MVNGASAALLISDVPWDGPVGCVRLGEIDGEFVVNPTNEQMYESSLDLIAGSEKEMMMIEGSADQIPEDRFVAALEYAHEAIQDIIGPAPTGRACAPRKRRNSTCATLPTKFLPSAARSPVTAWRRRSSPRPSRNAR